MEKGDAIIDGGNSYFKDDVRRGQALAEKGIHYVDAGTSGGVWGLERGYCLMIGGEREAVERLDPILKTLAPGRGDIAPAPGREGEAEHRRGRLPALRAGGRRPLREDGPQRHRVRPDAGLRRRVRHLPQRQSRTSLPEGQRYDLDLADIAEVWRRGSVVSSWLLDLTASALAENPDLVEFHRRRAGLRRGALDGASRRSRRRCRCTCSPPRSSTASARGRSTPSARRCSPPCATSSAATWSPKKETP